MPNVTRLFEKGAETFFNKGTNGRWKGVFKAMTWSYSTQRSLSTFHLIARPGMPTGGLLPVSESTYEERLSAWPSGFSGATISRTRCFNSVMSGKRPSSLRDQAMRLPARTVKTPPVPGTSATPPSSSSKVVNSSCAIQAARNSQRHCRQYSISMREAARFCGHGARLLCSARMARERGPSRQARNPNRGPIRCGLCSR